MWAHLKSLKRSGHSHDVQSNLPHLPNGSLALTCPACPQEGFNMRDDYTEDYAVPEELRASSIPRFYSLLIHRIRVTDLLVIVM